MHVVHHVYAEDARKPCSGSEITLKQEFTMYARMFFSSFDISRSAV